MTSKTIRQLFVIISMIFSINHQSVNAQTVFLDTIRFVEHYGIPFKNDKPKQTTQFPFTFSGFKANDTIVDLDFYLNLSSIYTNSNSIVLISPFGLRTTIMTTNSCPNQYGEDINVVFNDQAFDIDLWNNFGIQSPAFFQYVPKIPSIGSYNLGKELFGPNHTVGQMLPQADHLKYNNGSKLSLLNNNYKFTVAASGINQVNNTISGIEVEEFLSLYGIGVNELFTLKYDNYTLNPIGGLEPNTYYIFKAIDQQTITLNDPDIKIENVSPGSGHTFERNNTWIIEVYNENTLITGSLVKAGLYISYYSDGKMKTTVSNDSIKVDNGTGGMKIGNPMNSGIMQEQHFSPSSFSKSSNDNFYLVNNPVMTGTQAILKLKSHQSSFKTINIFNSFGTLVSSEIFNDQMLNEIILPSISIAGLYTVQLIEGNSVSSLKLMVQ